jgi:hypothetical protein
VQEEEEPAIAVACLAFSTSRSSRRREGMKVEQSTRTRVGQAHLKYSNTAILRTAATASNVALFACCIPQAPGDQETRRHEQETRGATPPRGHWDIAIVQRSTNVCTKSRSYEVTGTSGWNDWNDGWTDGRRWKSDSSWEQK